MTLRLDRLQRGVGYVDGSGYATTQFQNLWQRTMEAIERSDQQQSLLLAELQAQQAQLAAQLALILAAQATANAADSKAQDALDAIANGTAAIGGEPITTQSGTSGTIQRIVQPGTNLPVSARIRVDALTGVATQTIQVQSRALGGTWANLGTAGSVSGALGDNIIATTNTSQNNPGSLAAIYEFQAITTLTGAVGTVNLPMSFLSA